MNHSRTPQRQPHNHRLGSLHLPPKTLPQHQASGAWSATATTPCVLKPRARTSPAHLTCSLVRAACCTPERECRVGKLIEVSAAASAVAAVTYVCAQAAALVRAIAAADDDDAGAAAVAGKSHRASHHGSCQAAAQRGPGRAELAVAGAEQGCSDAAQLRNQAAADHEPQLTWPAAASTSVRRACIAGLGACGRCTSWPWPWSGGAAAAAAGALQAAPAAARAARQAPQGAAKRLGL